MFPRNSAKLAAAAFVVVSLTLVVVEWTNSRNAAHNRCPDTHYTPKELSHDLEQEENDTCNCTKTTPAPAISEKKYTRRFPQALIIGAQKCGTASLENFLEENQYFRSPFYEVDFFNEESNYERGLDWYKSRMPTSWPRQVTVERSPNYMLSSIVPARIYDHNPAMKLIVLLRHPTTRLISGYTHFHVKPGTAEYTHRLEDLAIDEHTGSLNASYSHVAAGIYHRVLRQWLHYFPRKQMLVLDGEELIRDPYTVVNKVEQFLGFPEHIQSKYYVYDTEKKFYCRWKRGQVKCMGDNKGREHATVSQEFIDISDKFYAPHNRELVVLLGQTFSWIK